MCSTGGSVTPEQIRIIRNLIQIQKMQLVLGNDNERAGMLSNLKIIADLKSYEYSKQHNDDSVHDAGWQNLSVQ